MKTFITVLVAFLTFSVFGQDDRLQNKDASLNSGSNKLQVPEIEYDEHDSNKVVVRSFYESGQIKSVEPFFPYKGKKYHGTYMQWFENGQLKIEANYEENILHGEVKTYYENGNLRRQDFFDNGSLIIGNLWDIEGHEIPHFDYFILAQFQGGESGMMNYLRNNIVYPKKSKRKGIQGRVIVGFVVEKDGSISDVKVWQGVNAELDKEAIKVVSGMPNWIPGTLDGEKVRVFYYLPIRFTLV